VKCDENKVESAKSAAMEFSEIPGRSTTPPINQAAEEIEQSTSRRRSESSSSSESDDRKNRKIRRLEERLSEMESRSRLPTQGDEKMIPEFKPQQSPFSMVRRVDEIAEVYGWNDLMIIRVVSNRLTGMARKWYDSQEYFKAIWKNIKHKLAKQFAKPLPFAKLLKEAALYETHEGQDLGEYCFTKLDKLRALKLKIPESSLVDAVIGGVTDENMARTARASRFGDVNELYSYLSTLGEMPRVPRGETRGGFGGKRFHSDQPKKVTNDKPAIQCFNCHGPHRVRDCKKPRLECFDCKHLGHIAKNCPQKKST
jgi:hypothetical protein